MRMIAAVQSARPVPVRALQALTLAVCALVAGCASTPPPPKPTSVKATVQAASDVNPDVRNRASPLVVRIYELKSAAAFEASDFLSLYDRDQATLGAEMVGREEFTMRPGEARPWEKIIGPEVRFIGVMAAYRDIERARWKTLIAVKPGLRNTVTIKADAIALTGSVVAQ